MSIELLFYTQLASILGYIAAAFLLYRLLVAQKDATIELMRQRNELLSAKITELEQQAPDVVLTALSKRVEISKAEIGELRKDGDLHEVEIAQKELELDELRERLSSLNALLKDSDLVCPSCRAPLSRRGSHPIFGYVGGREVEAEICFAEYECGYAISDDRVEPLSKCPFATTGHN